MIYTSLKEIDSFILTHSIPQHVATLHAIAHIESNAIQAYTSIRKLLPNTLFQSDIQQIIDDESRHFHLIDSRLKTYQFKYGDLPVHNNLENKIHGDLLQRLAITSIVSEGRALDRGDNLVNKVESKEDAKLLKTILKDEIRHVRIGLKWFNELSENPQEEFLKIMKSENIRCNWKINQQKRKKAGFDEKWLQALEEWKHMYM